jgi:asparaginyl-tRNA synthetase
MMGHVYIEDLRNYVGQEVEIRGWLYNRRESGSIQFLIFRDGTGLVQGVLTKKDAAFEGAKQLTQESSVKVFGTVKEERRAPGGYELILKDIEIVQRVEDDYPIAHKEHGPDFLLNQRHLWIRTPRQAAVLRIRHEVMQAMRDFFDKKNFIATESPIFTPSACEGTTTLFEVNYFDENKAYLSQSGQLYLEATAMALGRVYWIGPAFRAEKSKTRKHLTEFWMLEAEMAYFEHTGNMALQEELVRYIIQRCLEKRSRELKDLSRDTSKLEAIVKEPFARIAYSEAIKLCNVLCREKIEKGDVEELSWGGDFGAPHEEALAEHFGRPVFVEKMPALMKAFYMEPDPTNPDLVLAADLIAPEGYGEIIGGSQRISNIDLLKKRLKDFGLPEEPYQWYIDLRKFGGVPHAGFGMGVERTVSWVCGLEHLREAIPFPRTIYRLTP